MLKLKPTLFLLAVLSLFSDRVSAAIEFRTLSVNEGLSQSTVLAIAQDGMGRIWMGTQDGLNCYDGYSFTVFRHVEGDAQSLGDNSVNALFADGGLLWIGTASGLSCYDTATQSFENFRLEGRNMQVANIAATAGGDLILATDLGIEPRTRNPDLPHGHQRTRRLPFARWFSGRDLQRCLHLLLHLRQCRAHPAADGPLRHRQHRRRRRRILGRHPR